MCRGLFDRHLPLTVPQYDISTERECWPDEVPLEVVPCDNSDDEEWLPDEVELKTVTINSMFMDGKSVETDGNRGRFQKSPLIPVQKESIVNPDEWC